MWRARAPWPRSVSPRSRRPHPRWSASTRAPGSSLRRSTVSTGSAPPSTWSLDYSGSMKAVLPGRQRAGPRRPGARAVRPSRRRRPRARSSSSPPTSTPSPTSPSPTTAGGSTESWPGLGHMGRTSYHLAMDAVIDHYLDSGGDANPRSSSSRPTAAPINKLAAERYLCKAAKLPAVLAVHRLRRPRQQAVRLPAQARRTGRPGEAGGRQRRLLPRRSGSAEGVGRRSLRPARGRVPAVAGGGPGAGHRRTVAAARATAGRSRPHRWPNGSSVPP